MFLRLARILGCLTGLCAIALSAETAPSKQALKHFSDGQRHESQGQSQQAIEDYTASIQISSEYGAAIYHRGKLYVDLGDKKKALLDLTAAIRLMPSDPQPLVLRANLYHAMGQPKDAMLDWQQAINL